MSRDIVPTCLGSRAGTYGEELVEAAGVAAGMEVLDVAAGTEKVAIAAAARGARVIATDLTPAMIDQFRVAASPNGIRMWPVVLEGCAGALRH